MFVCMLLGCLSVCVCLLEALMRVFVSRAGSADTLVFVLLVMPKNVVVVVVVGNGDD